MKTKMNCFALVLTPAILLLGSSVAAASYERPVEDRIFGMAVAEMGCVPDEVELGDVNRIELPLSGTTLYQVKFADVQTGELFGIVIDDVVAGIYSNLAIRFFLYFN